MQLNKYKMVTPQILVPHFLDLCNLVISNFGRWFKTTFSVFFLKKKYFQAGTYMFKVNNRYTHLKGQ